MKLLLVFVFSVVASLPLFWVVWSAPDYTTIPSTYTYDDYPSCYRSCWDTWEAEGY